MLSLAFLITADVPEIFLRVQGREFDPLPSEEDIVSFLRELIALAKSLKLKEVRKKSLRDFHKTHPSGSGTVSKIPLGVEKITPTVTGEGTGSDEDSGQENESEEQESNLEQDEESDDDNQEEEEVDQEKNLKMMRLKVMKIRELMILLTNLMMM
ncbi:hypothetical protein Tco_0408432 [Tanacetum coccineum]